MRTFPAIAVTALMSLALCSQAGAQMTTAPAKPAPKKLFMSGDLLDPALTLPAPAKPETAEGKAQLDEVRAIVKASTPAEIEQAAKDDANESIALFTETLSGFDLAKLPMTAKLFHDVENDQEIVTKAAKVHFARLRPYELDPSIPTCVPSKPTAPGKTPSSYPSGHSTLGFTDGIILAHLIPAKAGVILTRAQEYARNRVVCGVHFSSDAIASEALATGMAVEMMQNADFQKEFAAAKAELVAAGLTN